ncbi:MAG: peptidoglycan-binding protein [Betaproteobacteria bacterium HGW-Betaproteobacteria-14]|nr:MAG: peptidoglycan-binding protein [Betaproteobacteria bacterium HGW-Betaproteobacteria-14]PKO94503.1 MAG: peptidoglycan-binding protein [Betaproteobacteria bacterium HGW-Betaproteobacteria-10]
MIRIISALLLSFSTACVLAQNASPPLQLADTAPDRHIVVPGDTLWGISGKFLKEPYRWPELWRMNKEQVKNPHLIYPGQILVLDRSGNDPQLRLETVKVSPKVHSEPLSLAIPSIPQSDIEPFLSRPMVLDEDGLKDAPKIVATQEDRVYLGPGGRIYVNGLKGNAKLWQVFRPTKPVTDPETNEPIGHEAFYLGTATLVAEGEPATLTIATAIQEIGINDRLVPATRAEIVNYAPHVPAKKLQGQVAAIYGGVKETGRHSIVTLNRGSRDGIEAGHVLAIYRNGGERLYRDGNETTNIKLPPERYGLVFVFRVFERISYALVMDVTRPVVVSDIVRTP